MISRIENGHNIYPVSLKLRENRTTSRKEFYGLWNGCRKSHILHKMGYTHVLTEVEYKVAVVCPTIPDEELGDYENFMKANLKKSFLLLVTDDVCLELLRTPGYQIA